MWATGAYGYLLDYLVWWVVFVSLVVHTACVIRFWPKTSRPRLRLAVGNALMFCSLLAFVSLVAETYLRFLSTATDSFGTTLTARRWFQAYPRLNSMYFRDAEWTSPKPAGVRRIAFVGDSFTYGWAINDPADRFSDLVQARFQAQAPGKVEVMNVAWLGWDTREEIRALDTIIPDYGIDEVVLCYLPNDIEPLLPVSEGFDPKKPPRSRFLNTSTSFLLDYLYHRVFAPRGPQWSAYWDWLWDGFHDPAIWKQHSEDLIAFAEMCRRHRADLKVVLVPFLVTRGEKYQATAIHARVRALFEEGEVPVLDLLPITQTRRTGDLIVNGSDAHPNESAHRLFADAIWQAFYAGRSRSEPRP